MFLQLYLFSSVSSIVNYNFWLYFIASTVIINSSFLRLEELLKQERTTGC